MADASGAGVSIVAAAGAAAGGAGDPLVGE